MSSAPLLSAQDLELTFPVYRGVIRRRQTGAVRALDGVSLAVREGETLGVVGESGCGKSTLVKVVLRMLQPTGGIVRFRDGDVHAMEGEDLARYRRQVQVVLQDPYSSLNPRMKIRTIIREPLEARRAPWRYSDASGERAEQLLDRVGLSRRAAELYPHQFSGGQRQRVAIARALASDPALILLDEPTSALDMSIRAQVMNLLKDLQRDLGLTYVLISHDLGSIAYMSSRIAVMYLGRIVETGPSAQVYRAPRHPYTGVLLASTTSRAAPSRVRRASGEVPSAMEVPAGCRFHTRCPLFELLGRPARCLQEEPGLREVAPGQAAACHFPDEYARQTAVAADPAD